MFLVCVDCYKDLSDKYLPFLDLLEKKEVRGQRVDNRDICEKLGVENMCCKMHLISMTDVHKLVIPGHYADVSKETLNDFMERGHPSSSK